MRLIAAGVARVIAAMQDPNPQVAGKVLRSSGRREFRWESRSPLRSKPKQLNEAYIHFMRTSKPLVMLKAAVTLDGKIAAPEDNRG